MRPKSHSVRRETDPVFSRKPLRSASERTMRDMILSQISSLRSKIAYGTSVMKAEAMSVAGLPSVSAFSACVRKLTAGCITSSRYSRGTRSVSSSQPVNDISSLPLPSVTTISQSWLLGVTPVRRR